MSLPRDEYRALMVGLATSLARRDAAVAEADRAYAAGMRAAEARVAAADTKAAEAGQAAQRAADAVIDVDGTAGRTWRDLRGHLGRRGRPLGDTPEPQPPEDDDADAPDLLLRAAHTLARARRGELPAPLPVPAPLLMPALGALAAAVVFGLARLLLLWGGEATETARFVVSGLAQVAVFAAPFAGVPFAVRLLSRRYGARVGFGTIALVVLGGVAAIIALGLALR